MTTGFHGTECAFYGAGYDLKPYLKSISVSGERGVYDASALADLWRVFRAGRVNGELSAEGFHSTGTGEFSEISQEIHGASKTFMLLPEGDTTGSVFAGIYGSVLARGIDTKLTDMTMGVLNVQARTGVDLGIVGSAAQVVTATDASAVMDLVAASSHGGALYFQCLAYTGTAANLGVELQDSANGTDFAAIVGTTCAITTADVVEGYNVRLTMDKGVAVRRYLKLVYTDVGGLTSATVVAGYAKYFD